MALGDAAPKASANDPDGGRCRLKEGGYRPKADVKRVGHVAGQGSLGRTIIASDHHQAVTLSHALLARR